MGHKKMVFAVLLLIFSVLLVPIVFGKFTFREIPSDSGDPIIIETVSHPDDQIISGTIPFYATISSSFSSDLDVVIFINNPDGVQREISMSATENDDEYYATYFDTKIPGTYSYVLQATKGSYKTSQMGEFKIQDVSIGNTDFIEVVKHVQNVEKVGEVLKITKQPTIDVFGTEYQINNSGRMFVQLLEGELPVLNASCHFTAYYPDNSLWYDDYEMNFLPESNGLYYVDFITPMQTGIYMVSVFCYYDAVLIEFGTPTYLNYDGVLDHESSGDVSEVSYSDCVFTETKDGYYQEFVYVDESIDYIDWDTIDTISFNWIGQNEVDDNCTVQIYNQYLSQWEDVGEKFGKSKGHDGQCHKSHAINRDFVGNFSQYADNQSGKFRIYCGKDDKDILTDYVRVVLHSEGTVVTDIRGSGEIHVEDYDFNLIPMIWSYVQNIYAFLTQDLWVAVFNLNQTTNRIENNTEEIIDKINQLNTTQNYEFIRNKLIASIEIINPDTYEPLSDAKLTAKAINNENNPSTGLIITVLIYSPSGTILLNDTMTEGIDGVYSYVYEIPEMEGEYLMKIETSSNGETYTDMQGISVIELRPRLYIGT